MQITCIHTSAYSANNFVSVVASIEHFGGHHVILLIDIVDIFRQRGVLGVNAKQVTTKQHHNTTNNHYGVDVRSRISNQPVSCTCMNTCMIIITIIYTIIVYMMIGSITQEYTNMYMYVFSCWLIFTIRYFLLG